MQGCQRGSQKSSSRPWHMKIYIDCIEPPLPSQACSLPICSPRSPTPATPPQPGYIKSNPSPNKEESTAHLQPPVAHARHPRQAQAAQAVPAWRRAGQSGISRAAAPAASQVNVCPQIGAGGHCGAPGAGDAHGCRAGGKMGSLMRKGEGVLKGLGLRQKPCVPIMPQHCPQATVLASAQCCNTPGSHNTWHQAAGNQTSSLLATASHLPLRWGWRRQPRAHRLPSK